MEEALENNDNAFCQILFTFRRCSLLSFVVSVNNLKKRMVFTHEEKCDMLESYLVCRKSSLRAKEYYAELYPLRIQPHERYFLRLYRKFTANDTVFAKTRRKKDFIIGEATEIAVIAYFEAYPENSIPDIVKDSNFSYGTVHTIIKNTNLFLISTDQFKRFCQGIQREELFFANGTLTFVAKM